MIHEASLVFGMPLGQLESMIFCISISFLNKKAKVEANGRKMLIKGSVMNFLLSHRLKKNKFVFDETIIHKEGWVDHEVVSQQFQQTFESNVYMDYGWIFFQMW